MQLTQSQKEHVDSIINAIEVLASDAGEDFTTALVEVASLLTDDTVELITEIKEIELTPSQARVSFSPFYPGWIEDPQTGKKYLSYHDPE